MSGSRLASALDEGDVTLPEGPVAVFRPPADYDLPLGPERAVIHHTFAPDVGAWEARGYRVISDGERTELPAAAIVVAPRAKALGRALIARAAEAPLVLVDGQKTDGIDSHFKAVRRRLGDLPSVAKAHGRLFWFEGGDFSDWKDPGPVQGEHGFWTAAGVFSDGEVDRGSALLAGVLPEKLKGRVADLGAGWGYLSSAVLEHEKVKQVDLIEAEKLALDCARLNIADSRAQFHWADALNFKPETLYDAVVMNPPFHPARAADPGLGQAFIEAAARILAPHGALWMVANRHLPYEHFLRERFRHGEELKGDGAFKLFHATRPRR